MQLREPEQKEPGQPASERSLNPTPRRQLVLPRQSSSKGLLLLTLGISLLLHTAICLFPIDEKKPEKKKELEATKPVKITKISTISSPRLKSQSEKLAKLPTTAAKPTPMRPRPASRPIAPLKSAAISTTASKTNTASSGNPALKTDEFAFTPYPAAEAGCLQLRSCFATSDSLTQVGSFFDKQLVVDGYQTNLEIDEGDRKVYRFSKNGKNRYLSIINVDVSTIYAAADTPKTYADLQSAVEIPPEFNQLIAQLGAASSPAQTVEQFAAPALFFAQLNPAQIKPEISNEVTLVKGKMPNQLFAGFFKPGLTKIGFSVPEDSEGNYGNGPVYRIQPDKSKPFFLNLVPTKDGTGSIVVVWLTMPPL